jgi:hypothetical protein
LSFSGYLFIYLFYFILFYFIKYETCNSQSQITLRVVHWPTLHRNKKLLISIISWQWIILPLFYRDKRRLLTRNLHLIQKKNIHIQSDHNNFKISFHLVIRKEMQVMISTSCFIFFPHEYSKRIRIHLDIWWNNCR